jgi:hypothetical protein
MSDTVTAQATRRGQYHLNAIPEADWEIVRAKAGARLAEGLKALIRDCRASRSSRSRAPIAPALRAAGPGRLGGEAGHDRDRQAASDIAGSAGGAPAR